MNRDDHHEQLPEPMPAWLREGGPATVVTDDGTCLPATVYDIDPGLAGILGWNWTVGVTADNRRGLFCFDPRGPVDAVSLRGQSASGRTAWLEPA